MLDLTVILPSVGRPTLARALRSLLQQRGHALRWEAVVVGDSHKDTWREGLQAIPTLLQELMRPLPQSNDPFRRLLRYVEHDGGQHAWGHPQRNFGPTVAQGRYVSWLGDDDLYLQGAFAAIESAIRERDPEQGPFLFRWIAPWRAILWQTQGQLEMGWIDAECIVTPNIPARLGEWTMRYQGDFDFIVGTIAKWQPLGIEPIWRPEIIAQAQPTEQEDWTRLTALSREAALEGAH